MKEIYPKYAINDPVEMTYDLCHDAFLMCPIHDTDWVRYNFHNGAWAFHRGTELLTIERKDLTRFYCELHFTYDDQNPEGMSLIKWESGSFKADDILYYNVYVNKFLDMVRDHMRMWNHSRNHNSTEV